MLTYTFSRREKALILVLAIILLFLAWFVFVFQRTTDEINKIDSDIAVVDSQTTVASAQVKRMYAMQEAIDKYKAAGVKPTPVPAFDNMTPLMTELNGIMGMTSSYNLSFDDLDTTTSTDYILRGVTAAYGSNTMADAENVVRALAKGAYPCSIDSVTIADTSAGLLSRLTNGSTSGTVNSSVHATFFEKQPKKTAASSAAATTSSSASTASASTNTTSASTTSSSKAAA